MPSSPSCRRAPGGCASCVCALSLDPRVLLLDEPSAGLAQREVEQLPALLDRVRELTGATVLLVEHDLPLVLGLSSRVLALESGRVIADGSPQQVRDDPEVQRSYLGGDPTAIQRSGPTGARTPARPPRQRAPRRAPLEAGRAAPRRSSTSSPREGSR